MARNRLDYTAFADTDYSRQDNNTLTTNNRREAKLMAKPRIDYGPLTDEDVGALIIEAANELREEKLAEVIEQLTELLESL